MKAYTLYVNARSDDYVILIKIALTEERDILFCMFTDLIWPSGQIKLSENWRTEKLNQQQFVYRHLISLKTPPQEAPCEAISIRTSVTVFKRGCLPRPKLIVVCWSMRGECERGLPILVFVYSDGRMWLVNCAMFV